MLNEIRKDYLLDRWVVIATHRGRRPTDFIKTEEVSPIDRNVRVRASCPFCPGNERKTPPAELVYLKSKNGIVKDRDVNGSRHKDWLIRTVPNLFSAFSPPENGDTFESGRAVGHHEVLIESPNHNEHPAVARKAQLIHVINGYIDRLLALSVKSYTKYVSIFRNYGLDAGASLSHAHSQIIATPMIPTIPRLELNASEKYYDSHGTCVFCDTIAEERRGPRFIWENEAFAVFAPWASVHPFEFWMIPKAHEASLLDMKPTTIKKFAEALKVCLGGLKSLLNDPPYNYGFHIAPSKEIKEFYHWHLEVYPRLTLWAGFEKSTGTYINVMKPEQAAHNLKDIIAQKSGKDQERTLS